MVSEQIYMILDPFLPEAIYRVIKHNYLGQMYTQFLSYMYAFYAFRFCKSNIMYVIKLIVGLQLLIIPEGTINGLNFSLECKANNITADINIKAPSGNVVTCNPTTQHVDASCPDPQYTINEETNTVSMTKEAANVDQGEWTCTHTTVPLESASQSITVNSK